jgi:hypothetical protein
LFPLRPTSTLLFGLFETWSLCCPSIIRTIHDSVLRQAVRSLRQAFSCRRGSQDLRGTMGGCKGCNESNGVAGSGGFNRFASFFPFNKKLAPYLEFFFRSRSVV